MRPLGVLVAAIALVLAASSSPAQGQSFAARVSAGLKAARAPLAQLERTSERQSLGTTFVRVRQEVDGIPVLGAEATLSLADDGTELLLDHTRRAITPRAAARISKAVAIAQALSAARVNGLRAPIKAGLAILPTGSQLVWRLVVPSAKPLADFEVLIDARTGGLVRVRDLLQHAAGQALVFDPNPVVEQGSRAGLADDGNKNSPALDALYRTVTLPDLDSGSGCPSGAWARTSLGRGRLCPSDRDFSAVRREDACECFEAMMAYFHIDRMQHYIQSLGFTNVVHRVIPVNLHATAQDNSFYSPSTGSLNFGDGGVNDAQDADVIDHEYGHAIQDSQIQGFGDAAESGAIGEGFGDYWQAAMSANLGIADQFNICFAEWDTSSVSADALPCLRRVDLPWTRSQASARCGTEIHCVGQAWSNLLWTIRSRLGGAAADKLILQSHFSYTVSSGFRDAALALLFADRQLNGGANQGFLHDLVTTRGFLSNEQVDDQPSGAQPLALSAQASGQLSSSTDTRDVFAVALTAGQGVVFHLRAGGAFALALYPPGTTSIDTGTALTRTIRAGRDESMPFVPTVSGTYFLAVESAAASGAYTVQALGDTDRDGVGDPSDNCRAVANANQADWNRNGRGDACDRASQTRIARVTVRGHILVVAGVLRPAGARISAWSVEVRKGPRIVARGRAASRKAGGRALAVVRIPARIHGRVQVRAVLRDPRYNRAVSKRVSAVLS